jgi:hypothetical protein
VRAAGGQAGVGADAGRGGRWRPAVVLVVVAGLASGLAAVPAVAAAPAGDSVVLQWNGAALQGVRESKLGPPMVSRALAIVHTCVFDAWAAYDPVAVGTRLGASLRRARAERTLANKEKAVSFAAYRAAVDVFPASTPVFNALMARLGYDPALTTTDVSNPAGVGNAACRAVLDFRHHDGSNQLGDVNGGAPYSDYTGYQPVNAFMDLRQPFDPAAVRDPNRWQPLRYLDATAIQVTPNFMAPHWGRVTPFALRSGDQLRSRRGPATTASPLYRIQAQELLDISANLTDTQKAIAEYWADGPKSELPPGHWDLLAEAVSRRDHYTLDQDTQLFFALTNAIFDAGIVAWDNKRTFDSERPVTAVRYLFRGQPVRAWAGPYQGTQLIDGATWLPYQPSYFPTPPFGEYSSGHSNFSAAGATVLELFTHSDRFDYSVTVPAGSSKVEPGAVPAHDVTLTWPTFSAAADQAGLSRRYGGIHFAQGDLDARATGRLAGAQAWAKAQRYILGLPPS